MQSAPWIQSGVMIGLAFIGTAVLLDSEVLYREKAPYYALLAAGVLITQQVGRIAATAERRIDWIDSLSLLLAAFYAGCSGWYWIAADANAAGPAWSISILVLFYMVFFGGAGWLAYSLRGK